MTQLETSKPDNYPARVTEVNKHLQHVKLHFWGAVSQFTSAWVLDWALCRDWKNKTANASERGDVCLQGGGLSLCLKNSEIQEDLSIYMLLLCITKGSCGLHASKDSSSPHCHLLLKDFPTQLTGWVPQGDPEGDPEQLEEAAGEKDMRAVLFGP